MTQRTYTAEAGTTGAAVSTGVAGPGETAWDAVSILAGSMVYDTANPAHGSKGIKLTSGNSNCYAQWAVTAHRQGRARGYWYAEAAPAANTATVWLGSAPSTVVIQISRNANGRVKLARSGGVAMWTSGVNLPLNQLVRWELRYSIDPTTSSASQAEVAFYLGDSLTPISGMSSGLITIDPQTTAEVTIARFGKYDTASNSDVVTHDSITHDDADWSALLGPYAQSLETSTSDGAGISDTASGVLSAARGVPDAVGAADSATATLAASRAAVDPVGLTDAVTAVLSSVRAISDAVTVTDLPGPQVLDVDLDIDDPAGVSDSVAQMVAAARTIADATGITDSITVAIARSATADDPIGVTDSASRTVSAARTVADPVEITDLGSPQAMMTIAQTVPDPIGILDTAATTQAAVRSHAETVGVTDAATATAAAMREPVDSGDVTDLVAAIMSVARIVTDAVGVTDTVEAFLIGAGAAPVEDQVGITDTPTTITSAQRGPADPAGASDQVTVTLTLARTHSDAVGLTDSVSAVLTGARTTADQVGATDQVTTITATVRSLADGATVTDSVTAVLIGPWRDIRINTGPATRRTIHPGRTL